MQLTGTLHVGSLRPVPDIYSLFVPCFSFLVFLSSSPSFPPLSITAVVATRGAQQVRSAHHHNYDSVDTPPPSPSAKLDTRIRKALRARNTVGYTAAWSLFTTEDGTCTSERAKVHLCVDGFARSGASGEPACASASASASAWLQPTNG